MIKALMGTGEATPTKPPTPASSVPEVSLTPTMPAYPDWSSHVQTLYGAGATPPFFASTLASPASHPYLWGGQHPVMAPYGTPVPYPALYPHGGVYAHPSMALTPGAVLGTSEPETSEAEGREQASKKSRGGSVSHSVKSGDGGNTTSGSGNDAGTQSVETGSGGSSDGSDNDNNQEFSAPKGKSFDQMLVAGGSAGNNGVPTNHQAPVPGHVVAVPATNLNIGMDLWNASPGPGAMKLHPHPPGVSPAVASPGIAKEQWIQDERELKRQKRKQSNRESARRSRMRKQAECEELQHKVEVLTNENRTLRDELQRLSVECEKLELENASMKEELTRLCGPEMPSNLEKSSSPSRENEANS